MHKLLMNAYWAACGAAGGNFLFGYDAGAIAGALLFAVPEFHLETKPHITGALLSSALIFAFLSTGIAGILADVYGRQKVMVIGGAVYSAAVIMSALAPSVNALICARALLGISNGLLVTCMPVYIAEVSQASERGRLATLPQVLSAFGVICSYSTTFLLSLAEHPSWRLMLGSAALPGLAYLLIALCLPESPRWLACKGRLKEACRVFQQLRQQQDVLGELYQLLEGLDIPATSDLEAWLLRAEPSEADSTSQNLLTPQYDPESPSLDYGHSVLGKPEPSSAERVDGLASSPTSLLQWGLFEAANKQTESDGLLQGGESATSYNKPSKATGRREGLISSGSSEVAAKVTKQTQGVHDLCEPAVQRALCIGSVLQVLQQAVGINAILYFTPLILMDSGVGGFLEETLGLTSQSSSLFASGVSSSFMVPCVLQAMQLMARVGRRPLLLVSLPFLSVSLLLLALATSPVVTGVLKVLLSFTGIVSYICFFFVGIGPVPPILCSEMFPTSISGICMSICLAGQRLCSILVSQSFPVLRAKFGSASAFGCFAAVSLFGWWFVWNFVPETKGMTLDAMYERFRVATRSSRSPEMFVE